jgi:hypothetical protein
MPDPSTLEHEGDPAPEWPPTQDPARATVIRTAIVGVSTAMVADLAAPSTDSGSRGERLILSTLRPFLPKLRGLFLDRLSDADPAILERLMGATSTTIEQILAEAPGEPLPRWRWVWEPGADRPELGEARWR